MSEVKRYKKDYKLDGWPIADTEARSILGTDDLVVILNEYEAAHKAQQAEIEKLNAGLNAVCALIDESYGVSGLHRNGETAPWSELRLGGRFEEWLIEFDQALEEHSDE